MTPDVRRVAVLGGIRIPFARQDGPYARASNQDMLTATLQGLSDRFDLEGETLGEVAAGAVLKHSRDFNLTRESVLGTKLAPETPAYDVQQACGTGLEATILVANKIALGQIESGIAGGVDTTSDAPLALNEDLRELLLDLNRAKSNAARLRALTRLRPGQIVPEIPRNAEPRTGLSMGEHTAQMAKEWGIGREEQDELAVASHHKLAHAYDDGFLDDLVMPYLGLERDQNLRPDSSLEKLAKLRPVFGGSEGTMTAGNSTPLSDGASAVLLASEEWAAQHGHPVQAHFITAQTAAVDHVHKREGLLMAPAYAVARLLARTGLTLQDFDFYEVHEAFAAQVLCTLKAWEDPVFCRERLGLDAPLGAIDRDKLNVHGGSLGAGHPFGATGGRIVANLAKALHERGAGRGLISICAAGGLGVTAIMEAAAMSDRYQQLINTPVGKIVSKQVGLPAPVVLERYQPGQPVIDGPVLLGAAPGARLAPAIAQVLAAIDAEVHTPMTDELRTAAADAGLDAKVFNPDAASEDDTFKALVFDASGIDSTEALHEAWAFFSPTIRRVRRSGRVIILGTPPQECSDPPAHIAQRALEGLSRAIAKEVRRGATGQLVYVSPGAEGAIESTLRFLLSPRSAYVSGQVIRIAGDHAPPADIDWERPLNGRVAVVTGASRGIGEAIAEVLARDGAHVVGIDVPAMEAELQGVTGRIGGSSLALDITEDGSPQAIAQHLKKHHKGVDVVVHNAGITRDKTLGRMKADLWDSVLSVNLLAPQRIDRALFGAGVVRENGRIIGVSSISGIAGNAGQTNYSTSKAGIIGFVESWAGPVAERGATVNAVAPGFIETKMTAAMPFATREAGRRMNSLSQGGLPIDVAETIAWFASPGSSAVNGNVVRVCGQSLIGA